MKIRKLKGFTLVELIIVMAITSILLVSIAAIFKPIGMLFQDASAYDTQRTIAEEINTYVCESIRYADNVYVYDKYSSLPSDAVAKFTNLPSDPTPGLGIAPDKVQIISILPSYKNTINSIDYSGRIFRQRGAAATGYEALGKWFYGKNNFKFDVTSTAANNISIKTTVNTDQLTADGACTLLNTNCSFLTSTGENTYILFTLPD